METRMTKWADKRAQIEQEAEELKQIIKADESKKVFDDMMGNPMETLEEILHAFD